MAGLLIGLAVLLAVAAVGIRRRRKRRIVARRRGASLRRPIEVRRFDQMDRVIARRVCRCGNGFELSGEGSRQVGTQRFRIAHLVCPDCGAEEKVYFDVTRVFH